MKKSNTPQTKNKPFKHEFKIMTKDEVLKNRCGKYKFIELTS